MLNYNFVKPEVYFEGAIEPFVPFKLDVGPLPKGFGETLANPMRRLLLGYVPGVAVVGYKIPGVVHDMQEIPGASSDTIELLRNLKQARFQMEEDTEEIKTLLIETKKSGMVYARDLKLPNGVKVMNPDQEILLVNGGEFKAEIFIQKGYGYKDKHEHEELNSRFDIIKIDTNYSPITEVGYEVGIARVGDEAKYDKIVYTITSDGSIHPKEAVELAVYLLGEMSSLFLEMSDIQDKTKLYKEKKEERDRLMETPIELLNLSQRSYNALKNADIDVVRQLSGLDRKTLAAVNQLGKKSVEEIIEVLASKGIIIPD